MAHESMVSYYSGNFNLMFYKDIGFVNNLRLEDLEQMHPFERDIYIIMMNEKLEQARNNK
jgi:hypothetical protein